VAPDGVVAWGRGRLHRMSSARPWPALPEEDRWALELMEELLEDHSQTPEQLQARARELRAEAAETDIKGIRDAALVLAERYEEAAAARVASA
jgi:hypothetical protein